VSARATEALFLPAFDGDARLRDEFTSTLADWSRARHARPTRGIGYPNRTLGSLEGYWRHVASQVSADSRPVLIAESFSGLVAARWAASDPRIAGLVLCGAFARNPAPVAATLGAWMPAVAHLIGSTLLNPFLAVRPEARRDGWSSALPAAIRALDRAVVGERFRLIAREDIGADLSALRIPVVLVQFEGDRVIGRAAQRHLESVCHNARIVRQPGPHFAIETRPIECARAIAACLAPLFE